MTEGGGRPIDHAEVSLIDGSGARRRPAREPAEELRLDRPVSLTCEVDPRPSAIAPLACTTPLAASTAADALARLPDRYHPEPALRCSLRAIKAAVLVGSLRR